MNEPTETNAPSDDALLYVMQVLLRALTEAMADEYPGDPAAAKQAASEHIARCMANPLMLDALMEGEAAEELGRMEMALERHRTAFAEALLPGVGTPNAFNMM